MHHRRFSSSRVAEVGLGRRETASKVGSRPLDSPTSSPGPLNFEEVSRCTRERERDSSPLTTDDNAFDIGNIISVVARDRSLVKHENSVCFEETERNFRKCARS